MIIVYSGKPMLSQRIALHLFDKYPSKQIVYIHAMYFTNVSFDYPQNIKWEGLPYLQTPLFKISDIKNWKAMTLINEKLETTTISFQDIVKCEKIIYAGDPCSSDCSLFGEFIKKVFNKEVDKMHIDALYLSSLDEEGIMKAIDEMSNFSDIFKDTLNRGKVQKYFNYNFNFNSFCLLGKAYEEVNKIFGDKKNPTNHAGRIFISKNMLQLLYFVRQKQSNNINYRQGSLISQMNKWKGTGKYTFRAWFGSCTSYSDIIENLLALKLLCYIEQKIFLTEKGNKFLQTIPKDCMDLDLPFRIELWSSEPFEESKVKIDNYLKTYYKKIKNKLKEY